jgi:dynamin 1-like protein
MLLRMLSEYSDRFSAMLDGKCLDLPTNELAGGARVRHVFIEVFVKGLREFNPSRELTDEDIRTAIKNSAGVSGQ